MRLVSTVSIAVLILAGIGGVVLGQSGLAVLSGTADTNARVGRQVCVGCGGDSDPSSISADGRFLLFNGRNGMGGLSIREISTGKVTQLLTDPSFSPVLSPDGQQIVYMGATNSITTFSTAPLGSYDLRVVANQVGAKPRILNNSLDFWAITPAAWAPDGKSILAYLRIAERGSAYAQVAGIGWVSASDGTVQIVKRGLLLGCCHEGLPALSPDGKSIAYAARPAADADGNHIYVLSADNSAPEIELVRGGANQSPVWTPDGKNLLFVSDRGGRFGLWSVAVKDGALTPILPDTGRIINVGVSKSGSYFYTRSVWHPGSAFALRQYGLRPHFPGGLARWSRDGMSFAFLNAQQIGGTFQYHPATLHVYSLKTKKEMSYVPGGDLSILRVPPQWFHNGKSLVLWVEDAKGKHSPYRVDLETGVFKRIAEMVSSHAYDRLAEIVSSRGISPLGISSDDRTAYVILAQEGSCKGNQIVAVDLDSGESRRIASVSTNSGIFPSADDKTLYMLACDEAGNARRRIVSVDVATGKQRDIFTLKSSQSLEALALSPNSGTLAVIVEESSAVTAPFPIRSQRLARIETDGTGYTELFTIPAGNLENVSWSSNGEEIFFEESLLSEGALLRISANGGPPRIVWRKPVKGSVSPDGSDVMEVKNGWSENELWVLDDIPSLLKSAP